MKPGQESQTAVLVAAGRAIADGRTPVSAFHDTTAFALLPPDAQDEVRAIRAGERGVTAGVRIRRTLAAKRATMLIPRTVAIDAAVRAAASPQLVILGAGLDGRAWRMPELRDVTVFEVDHPDSQRVKRTRASALTPTAREIRFVPVDFAADDLGSALAAAGHDPTLRTTWVWEGVVMYLTRKAIEATLAVIRDHSAAGSRLEVAYTTPALILALVGWMVRRAGEPLRSAFRPTEMRALLSGYGFRVLDDEDMPALARRLAPEIAAEVRPLRHFRIVTAQA